MHDSHNSSICEIDNNTIVYYQEAERINKKKKTNEWSVLFKKYKNEYFDKIIFVFSFSSEDSLIKNSLQNILNKKNIT